MARGIKEIEAQIQSEIADKLGLSTSAVAEWKLWATVIAAVIYSFELIIDVFKKEIEERTDKAIPGTLRWYANLCRKWQMGDTLQYNPDTSEVYYQEINPEKQLISALSVVEGDRQLTVKVAKGQGNALSPLSATENFSFKVYLDKVKFAGDRIEIISTEPDIVKYKVAVYTDGLIPSDTLKERVRQTLDSYRFSLEFNGTIHIARVISALLNVENIVTADVTSFTLTPKGGAAQEVTTSVNCIAGYFDFDHAASIIEIISND